MRSSGWTFSRRTPERFSFLDAILAPNPMVFSVMRRLVQLEDDVLDVLADVAGLGQRRGVHDREGDGEQLGERLGEEGLAGPRGPNQEDVGLLELDVELAVLFEVVDPLVMVVDSNR